MSNSHECMGVNGEALQLHAVYQKPYFILQVTQEPISVLQVTRESVSRISSHVRCVWMCNEIEGSYDKIIITTVPSYSGKNLLFGAVGIVRTRNNTDGNRLVIFCQRPSPGDHTHWDCSYVLEQLLWLHLRHGLSFTHNRLAWEFLQ